MGGSIGVSALGSALSGTVSASVMDGLARLGIPVQGEEQGTSIPDMSTLPAPVREVFEHAFSVGIGHVFLLATPFAFLALLAILLIKETPLRETIERQDELQRLAEESAVEPVTS
jgi:hypothetical protein